MLTLYELQSACVPKSLENDDSIDQAIKGHLL